MLYHLITLLIFSEYYKLVGSVEQLTPNEVVQEVRRDAFNDLLHYAAAQRVHAEGVDVGLDLVEQFAQFVHRVRHGLLVRGPLLLHAVHVVREALLDHALDHVVAVLVFDHLVEFVARAVQDGFRERGARVEAQDLLHALDDLAALGVETGVDQVLVEHVHDVRDHVLGAVFEEFLDAVVAAGLVAQVDHAALRVLPDDLPVRVSAVGD